MYTEQCKFLGKESRIFLTDAFNFETFVTGGENWTNFVDTGPGSDQRSTRSELAIDEFDPSMLSVMNFNEPEAFKALICPLGLEEFRSIVYYEMTNLYLLITAVRHN